MEATGSVLTNKYSEGYAHKRYYEGQQVVDQVEELAIARLKALFGGRARQRAALLGQPGEPRRVLRVLPAGRHRSWASRSPPAGTSRTGTACRSPASTSRACSTASAKDDHRIDMDQVRDAGARAPPEAPLVRDDGVPADARLRGVPRHRRRGRRHPRRRHRAHLGPRLRGRAPVAGRHRRRRDLDDAQDVPRSARRDDLLQEGARRGHRPRGVPGPAGRPAQPRHGGHRRRGERGSAAGVQGVRAEHRRERARRSARRWPSGASASSPAGPTTTCSSST